MHFLVGPQFGSCMSWGDMAYSGMCYSHFCNGVRIGAISINVCYEVNALGFGLRYQKPAKSDSKIRFSIFLDIETGCQNLRLG